MKDISTKFQPSWCPGCGDHGILAALKAAITELKLDTSKTVISTGIGCGSKINHFINVYGFEGLHGRALPVATGIKLANNELNVIAVSGDGDGYGIGGNHFIHTCRRNINITYITQDNSVYGLTKGQTSPTSKKGYKSESTPFGVIEEPVNPIALAITMGATFVARVYAFDFQELKEIFKEGIKHRGFSVINVLQPCVTFNKINTADWYKERIYYIKNHDSSNKIKALDLALKNDEKIPLGIFYKEEKKTYDDEEPQIAKVPLVKQSIDKIDIRKTIDQFK